MADSAALKIELDIPDGPRPSDAPRELREVIPAGRGRIDRAEYIARIRRAQRSGMQSLMKLLGSEHSGEFERPSVVCIVGGGPSLCDEVAVLRRMIKHGAKVLAVNKSHDWLLRRALRRRPPGVVLRAAPAPRSNRQSRTSSGPRSDYGPSASSGSSQAPASAPKSAARACSRRCRAADQSEGLSRAPLR